MDFDNIQIAKDVQRYDRIYKTNLDLSSQGRLSSWGFQNVKLQLFRDYEQMDRDPIISSVLDLYSQQVVAKNEYGDVLQIKSQNQQIVQLLDNLFYNVLNVQFSLPSWVRSICKYGDMFVYLDILPQMGVINAIPLSTYQVQRQQVQDQDNIYGTHVKFKLLNAKQELQSFQMAHFRLLLDSNYLPYGKSLLQGSRKTWKQLCLMQDAAIIHKIMRAPQKRIFNVGVGNLPNNKIEAYMQNYITKTKKVPYVDPKTGDYNMRFNMMNMIQDFYIPRRGGNDGNSIQTLSGFQLSFEYELDYLRQKMMSGFRVPFSHIGYEQNVNSKATLMSQDIRFARAIQRIQRFIVSELHKIATIHLYCHGYKGQDLLDFQLKLHNPSVIYQQQKLAIWQQKFNLIGSIQNTQILSNEWCYKNILNMSNQQIFKQRQQLQIDKIRQYKMGILASQGKLQQEQQQTQDQQDNMIGGDFERQPRQDRDYDTFDSNSRDIDNEQYMQDNIDDDIITAQESYDPTIDKYKPSYMKDIKNRKQSHSLKQVFGLDKSIDNYNIDDSKKFIRRMMSLQQSQQNKLSKFLKNKNKNRIIN